MKLLIDIGNTNTSLAVVEGNKILKRYFIHTAKKQVAPKSLKRLLGRALPKIDNVIIVSVVPKFRLIIEKSLTAIMPRTSVSLVGRDIKVPMKNKYRKPREVGQDRLVAAFAAKRRFGSPVLVVDFGTAVTFDFVNKRGEYEGGLIFPGLRLALKALVNNTALLPMINIKPVKGFIGRDTRGSMTGGLLYGYAAMCDGIINNFKDKYGKGLEVVSTGGDARLIARYSRLIEKVSPDLIFDGLKFLSK